MNNTVIDTRYVLVTSDDRRYVKSHSVYSEYTSDIKKAKAFARMETAQKYADEINHKNATYGYEPVSASSVWISTLSSLKLTANNMESHDNTEKENKVVVMTRVNEDNKPFVNSLGLEQIFFVSMQDVLAHLYTAYDKINIEKRHKGFCFVSANNGHITKFYEIQEHTPMKFN